MTNLYCQNTPWSFWLCEPDPPREAWLEACRNAIPVIGMSHQVKDIDTAIALTLGEGQFGSEHWHLSRAKRLYYTFKPILPCSFRYVLRRLYNPISQSEFPLQWPIEDRYVRFLYEVARQLLTVLDLPSISFRHFWPEGYQYAFVLTHDIETCDGQDYVRKVADLEEELGFSSSFNFVPECYELDIELMQELRERGFEIGVHGLKHDGKLFNSKQLFMERAASINQYLLELGAIGFRSPLMMRNPEWLQALQIEYDLSFFDTDPFQPIPGGVMSIWPFFIGRFVELPYTLVQDSMLALVLGETTPKLWLQKVDFIEKYQGMVLVNTHPDYLSSPAPWKIYSDFLQAMRYRKGFWNALPREIARWWRQRVDAPFGQELPEIALGDLHLENDHIELSVPLAISSELSSVTSNVA